MIGRMSLPAGRAQAVLTGGSDVCILSFLRETSFFGFFFAMLQ